MLAFHFVVVSSGGARVWFLVGCATGPEPLDIAYLRGTVEIATNFCISSRAFLDAHEGPIELTSPICALLFRTCCKFFVSVRTRVSFMSVADAGGTRRSRAPSGAQPAVAILSGVPRASRGDVREFALGLG